MSIMPVRKALTTFIIGVLFALLVLEAGLRLFGSRYDRRPAPGGKNEYTILCLGDSFVYGIGAPPEKSYPRQLQEILDRQALPRNVRVIGYGFPGRNTTQLQEIFARDIETLKPDLLIFLGGMINGNNFYGYHAFRQGGGFGEKLKDRAERIRVWKLVTMIAANIRDKRAVPGNAGGTGPEPKYAPQAVSYFYRAREKQSEDNRPEAKELALRAVAADPSFAPPYALLGSLSESEGKTAEAIRYYQRSMELSPDQYAAFSLGTLYLNAESFPGALRAFEQGLASRVSPYNNCLNGFRELLSRPVPEALRGQAAAFLRSVRPRMDRDGRQIIDDILAGRPSLLKDLDAWRARDINKIIDGCRKRGIAVILMDYPEMRSVIREIAAERGLPYVDNCRVFSELLKSAPRSRYFSSDTNHCNAEGYRVMAGNAAEKIRELGLLR